MTTTQDWSDLSLIGLFRIEVETQISVLNEHLLLLEQQGQVNSGSLDSLMRAAHSIKGAARIVQIESAVKVSHVLEEFFLTVKQGTVALQSDHVDVLLQASDFLLHLSTRTEEELSQENASAADESKVNALVLLIEGLVNDAAAPPCLVSQPALESATTNAPMLFEADSSSAEGGKSEASEPEVANAEPLENETTKNEAIKNETLKDDLSQNLDRRPAHNIETKTDGTVDIHAQNTVETTAAATADTTFDETAHKTPVAAGAAARMIRMSADNLNCLMGLAGESLVESNWLQPFSASLLQLKRQQQSVLSVLEGLEQASRLAQDGEPSVAVTEAVQGMQNCHNLLSDQLSELDLFSQRFGQLSDRLYREVIASHMCAFEMGTKGYPRLVRDLSKSLGKQVTLEIEGLMTQVDRDILEKLDAPITHLLTNAIAHGIEQPDTRVASGKSPVGTIRIQALHRSGMLLITVEDDGAGIDFAQLRAKIVHQGMTPADIVDQLSEAELIEFLFLPGFSTASQVDKVAGRGYGLDIARNMVQAVGGALQATSVRGQGTRFQFQLPLTLSVVRSLLFEVAGEPYAMSLARIGRVLNLSPEQIRYSENKPYFSLEGESDHTELSVRITDSSADAAAKAENTKAENISLISASQLLSLPTQNALSTTDTNIWVMILGEPGNRYGLCVDQLLEERDLVVRPLDARLGKVPNVSSAALTEKGEPILILDVADVLRSAAKLAASSESGWGDEGTSTRSKVSSDSTPGQQTSTDAAQKRILVVDDSMTVRAMEKKLLKNRGYAVDVAINGAEGWNAVRMNTYDLVVTDVDMPRMSGIELIKKMRDYPSTRKLPVIVVSYKDRKEDQLAGLNAGANYYLTKSSFHDDGLINAVVDLIGS